MKQNKKNRITSHTVHAPTGNKLNFLLFIIVFGIFGGVVLYLRSQAAVIPYVPTTQHRSVCVANNPSKTVVKPGETFTAQVRIRNTGTSTFSRDFGTSLYELRDSAPIWSATGLSLTSPIPPGGTATFNLRVKAPSNPGTYSFNWGMLIVFQGFIREGCTGSTGGRTIRVTNPPSVNLNLNNRSSNITVTQNQSLSLSWSVGNGPTSCTASGSWSGNKAATGTENRSVDTISTGTKSYTLNCSNEVGSSVLTRTVTVNRAASSGGGSQSPAPSRPSGGGSTTTPRPSGDSGGTTQSRQQQPVAEPIQPPDPTNFSALANEDGSISLSWELPEYFGALTGYKIERSTDNENWERIGPESLTDQAYTDTATDFQTTYYYRVQALEASGLTSGYAAVEATTGQFSSNLNPEGTTLSSDDQSVSVFIPKDAIEGDASCNLFSNTNVLPPAEDTYVTLTGPYDILCKDKDGNIIESFKVPVEITVNENSSFKNIRYFSFKDDWQEIQFERTDSTAKFTLQEQITFIGTGQEKTTPLWIKILVALLIVGGIIIGGIIALKLIVRIRQRNAYQSQSEDYYRKEHGY